MLVLERRVGALNVCPRVCVLPVAQYFANSWFICLLTFRLLMISSCYKLRFTIDLDDRVEGVGSDLPIAL